jgi:hypothetical protein
MISPIGKVSNKPQTHPGSMARWLDGGINGSIYVARWLDANGGCLQPRCLDARLDAGLDAKFDAGSMHGSMQARCRLDAGSMQARCRLDAGSMPRCRGSDKYTLVDVFTPSKRTRGSPAMRKLLGPPVQTIFSGHARTNSSHLSIRTVKKEAFILGVDMS